MALNVCAKVGKSMIKVSVFTQMRVFYLNKYPLNDFQDRVYMH